MQKGEERKRGGPRILTFLSRFFYQCARAQLASTSNGSNRPPRPAHCAVEPPGYYGFNQKKVRKSL